MMDSLLLSFLIFGFIIVFSALRRNFEKAKNQVIPNQNVLYDHDGKTFY